MDVIKKIENYFEKEGNAALGLSGKTNISILGKGESNLNLLAQNGDKEFVVRVSLLKKSRTEREYTILKAVKPLRIAPRPFIIDNSKRFIDEDFIVIEKLPGAPLTGHLFSEDAVAAAKILSKLHRKKYSGFGMVGEKLKEGTEYACLNERLGWAYSELNSLVDEVLNNTRVGSLKGSILPVLFKMKSKFNEICVKNKDYFSAQRFSMVHGDFRQWNLLKHQKGLSIVDWELARIADPAEDIANFFTNSYISKPDKKIFMKEYVKHERDKNLEKRIKIYELLHMMSIAYWIGKRHYHSKTAELHPELNPVGKDKEYLNYFFYFISKFIKTSGLDPRMSFPKAKKLGWL